MSFNFGSTNQTAGKSLFGGATPATQGFNFGAATQAQSTGGGFSFGGAAKSTPTAAPSGFSFGTPAAATTAATPAGGAAAKPAGTGFSFGATPTQAQSTADTPLKTGGLGGFSLAGSTPAKPTVQGLSLGSTATSAAPTTGINLGGLGTAKPVAATGPAAVGVTPLSTKTAVTTTKTAGVNLGGLATSTSATKTGGLNLGLGTAAQATTKAGGLNLGTSAAKPTGLTLGGAGAASTLGGAAKTSAPSLTISLGKTANTTIAPTTTAAAAPTIPTGPTMNYRELEEAINKWTLELEEQEKVFLQQATQVNGWDRLLVENGEKITILHNDVEKVKADQQRLEHELDYIVAQQRELEDMLTPLEDVIKTQQGSIFTQHADVEREHTYQLTETIDSQLKRMVQDLKEVIEHLNTSNTAGEASDPIHQIAKILNAHMDSLQWIDHNTAMCQRKVDEISRQSEIVRRDQERNVQLAFD